MKIKKCKHCSCKFQITDSDLAFYDKASPTFSGEKFHIPTPTLCPDCRLQRKICFRNERNLYKRKSHDSGNNIISIYSPDKDIKVYSNSYWWSDDWDAEKYGIDFSKLRSFLVNFKSCFFLFRLCHCLFHTRQCKIQTTAIVHDFVKTAIYASNEMMPKTVCM